MVKDVTVYQFKNEKQNEFFDTVMQSVAKVTGFDFRYFFYGGAIRGGKTFVCLFILWYLANIYPGSRWYVIREDNPALESTSIPSMEKLIGKEGENFKWKRNKGSTQVVLNNGSRIFFKSENLQKDKDLKEFLGLEMNGCLLEQMEALSFTLFTRCLERLGSWYIDPMPIPLLLGTFNPTPLWVKSYIYDKHMKGELESPYYYKPALPEDNPFVTPDQWANWANLDPESQRVMIQGIWTFKIEGNLWAYSFDAGRHIKSAASMILDNRLPVYLVFDFNVDPMTCLVCQRDSMKWGKVLFEYRLRNSDIFELCDRIKIDLAGFYWVATGDASGRNRTASTRGNKSNVDILRAELGLSSRQTQFALSNPSIANTRTVVNSVLHNHKNFYISELCPFLIDDLTTIKTDNEGNIDKKKIDPLKTHLLDNLRYFMWNYFRTFIHHKF